MTKERQEDCGPSKESSSSRALLIVPWQPAGAHNTVFSTGSAAALGTSGALGLPEAIFRHHHGKTKLSPQQLKQLLRLCLKTTYFKYEGKFYSQVEGAAMGSHVSPIVANLFMEWLESRALTTFPNPPKNSATFMLHQLSSNTSGLYGPKHISTLFPGLIHGDSVVVTYQVFVSTLNVELEGRAEEPVLGEMKPWSAERPVPAPVFTEEERRRVENIYKNFHKSKKTTDDIAPTLDSMGFEPMSMATLGEGTGCWTLKYNP
ncbi:hypothetical protein Bbelb_282920 [Branchiostoma belcheri]|nr:hypothetical protein Bbelb_282920 [Branchiostoma belcheri]